MWRIKTVSSQAEAIVNINASSLENIIGEKLIGKTADTEIAGIFKDAYKDLGYDIEIIFSDPKNSPQLLDENDKPKTGTAYVRDENGKKIKTIIINGEDPKNATKAGLIGTIVEEGSHIIGKVEDRQRKTGTDEKGLESTGRASNEYFTEKYKDENTPISIHSDGKDYSNVDFGENVGNVVVADDITIIFILGTGYVVYQGSKAVMTYATSYEAQKHARELANATGAAVDTVIRKGGKWIWNGVTWVAEQGGRIFAKRARQVQPGEIIDTPDTKPGTFEKKKNGGQDGFEGEDGSWWEKDYARSKGHGGSTWKRWPKKPNPKRKKEDPDRRTIGKDGKVIRRW